MKSLQLPFCFQTIFLATGLFYLFDYFGPTPSPQLTLLLVLISALLLKGLALGWCRLKAWRQQKLSTSASAPPTHILITEKEEEVGHENLSHN
jgi:cytochrome c oxidase subunit IV